MTSPATGRPCSKLHYERHLMFRGILACISGEVCKTGNLKCFFEFSKKATAPFFHISKKRVPSYQQASY